MAHWAEIDENNIVTRVVVGSNTDLDEGYQWLVDNLGGNWIKTSYNTKGNVHLLGGTPLRKNFAEPGFTYDPARDAFIPQMPETISIVDLDGNEVQISWIFNEEACLWDMV
jgi:hypothetical protein